MPFDHFPDAVVIAGPDGLVEYVNERFDDWIGMGADVIGQPLGDVVPFDDLSGNRWVDCVRPYDGLATRRAITEQSWYSPQGIEYLITASLLRDRPGGVVQRVVMCIRSARARNHRDRERSDLVATVAHELRSPLTGIKGFSSTLLSKWDKFSDEQRRFMLETVDADADRLSRLITDLLDAARIDSNRLSLRIGAVRLDTIVEQVMRSSSAGGTERGWSVDVDRVPLVWGDADRLVQAFTNVVENAGRHGHGLRAVSVHGATRNGVEGAEVTFVDSGPGIPEPDRERIFNRFWRSGPGAGSGLGMYIVGGVVGLHDGTVTINDADGGGAQISIWLPINEPAVMSED